MISLSHVLLLPTHPRTEPSLPPFPGTRSFRWTTAGRGTPKAFSHGTGSPGSGLLSREEKQGKAKPSLLLRGLGEDGEI